MRKPGSSIYHKVMVAMTNLDDPTMKPIEACPFHINLLNAAEEISHLKINQGVLTEYSDRVWRFVYNGTMRERPCRIQLDLTMTRINLFDEHPVEYIDPKQAHLKSARPLRI